MGDFSKRRLSYQRYNSKDENAMVRLGDIIDCFPNTLSVGTTTSMTGAVTLASTLGVDTINEYTSATGVTIDGVLVKDNTLTAKRDSITEISTTVLTAADSGKVFFINSDSGISTYTLPTPAVGLKFKWIVTANCDTATIIQTADSTDTSGDMLRGGLLVCSAAAINTFVEAAGDVNTLTLDDNVVNAGQGIGSWIEVICTEDPTWFITGVLNGNTDVDGVGSALFTDAD